MAAMRQVPGDPTGAEVEAIFELDSAWILSAPGDYRCAAAEAMRFDGSGYQRVVILEWPGRINKTDEQVTLRVAIAPEDALGLATALTHSACWLQAAEQLEAGR